MCEHSNFTENQDGDKECLDCGAIYIAEDPYWPENLPEDEPLPRCGNAIFGDFNG